MSSFPMETSNRSRVGDWYHASKLWQVRERFVIWIIRYLPKSSFNRTLLLIAAVMLLSQGAAFWFIAFYLSPSMFATMGHDTSLMVDP